MKIILGHREFDILNDTLRLKDAGLTKEELTALCDILKTDKRITALYLGDNNIGDEGAKAIAEALKGNKTLTHLGLSGNNIGDEGAKAIAEALKGNKILISLGLSDNKIGDEGAKAITEALKVNKTLASLNLWQNNIGNEGAKAIAEALKDNTSLSALYLIHNNIGDEGVAALDGLLIKNTCLLSYYYAHMSSAATKEFDARQGAFRALVANLAKNEPYTGAISAIQFHWLKNHGRDFYNDVSDQNKISYEDFETKWQTVVLKNQEQVCYQKFKMNFNILELDPVMLEGISTANQHMITTTEPKKFEMPEDIIRHMFNQLTLQEKIDQLSR